MSDKNKRSVLIEEFDNGKIESEVISLDGVNIIKHGESKMWLKSQLVRSEYYSYDKLDGPQTKYYTNGDVYKIVNWVAGIKHGKVTINLENGTRIEYDNVHGEISGPKYTWDNTGDLIEVIEYD